MVHFLSATVVCFAAALDTTNVSNSYAGGMLEPALLYGVLPALTLWLGSLPVALATWLLWRGTSAWAIPAFAVAVIPSLGLVLYAAEVTLPIPAGCYFNCPPGPGDVLPTSFAIAGVLAMLSLPVWIHLGILHLLDGSHNGCCRSQIGAEGPEGSGAMTSEEKDLLMADLVDAGERDPDGEKATSDHC